MVGVLAAVSVTALTLIVAASTGAAREGASSASITFEPLDAADSLAGRDTLVVGHALVIQGADWYRSDTTPDPIEARIVRGEWLPPREGETIAFPDSVHAWRRVEADSAGWISSPALADGYAYALVESPAEGVMILEGFGYQSVYVNGELRTGNIYGYTDDPGGYGWLRCRIPVLLVAGPNQLLFHRSRAEQIKARFVRPPASVFLNATDVTLPDPIVGEAIDTWGAVVAVNATREWQRELHLVATVGDTRGAGSRAAGSATGTPRAGAVSGETRVPDLPPLSVRKVPFRISAPAPAAPGETMLALSLVASDRRASARADTLSLAVKRPGENRRYTFVSEVDGSVQYYAVNPAQDTLAGTKPALFLTLHGASVEAWGQAAAYAPKSWGHLVAPTNRRPYGFNWEDWGRLDALEVLDLALATLTVDPQRVYLTGHSMGGHGAWHLGVLYPDRFAAVGPSAGWISFWSYRPQREIVPRTDVEEMIARCTLPSRTLDLAENLAPLGVYVLHGADDDNVPAEQARIMVGRLSEFHRDFIHREVPGVGHWWDLNDEPGADCVDWPAMFDFFAGHARPGADRVREVRFCTPSPGISATNHWVTIEDQVHALQLSRVDVRMDPVKGRFTGSTENVARLTLDLTHLAREGPSDVIDHHGRWHPAFVVLDGDSLWVSGSGPRGTLRRTGDGWESGGPAPRSQKGPHRYGTFRDAFRNRVVFVYGTAGSPEEVAWAFAKARYDAEHFWYQANGSIEVIPDHAFDPAAEPDRNVVLYGNAQTNRAWKALLGDAPVQVRDGELRMGGKVATGNDLAVLLIRPRPGSDTASVGAVAGTGLTGMRLCDRRPYLSAGFAYPDLTVFRADASCDLSGAAVLAGFFGPDWRVETGEFAGDLSPRP